MPPPLDLVEMGLPEHLMTTVVAIEPCPQLEDSLAGAGPGRVVLTTVNHLNNDVWELTAENAAGRREQLRPTRPFQILGHKFYSETRQDWVSTQDIHDREVIRGRAGPLTIVAAEKLPGTQRVYNLTVEGEHVYYVSELGLLAHNNCGPQGFTNQEFADLSTAVRRALDAEGLPAGELLVHGSRASRTAVAGSDIDIILRLSDEEFGSFAARRIAQTTGGNRTAILKTVRNQQRIRARGISSTLEARFYDEVFPLLPDDVSKVQISIVTEGSSFNTGPFIPLN